MKPVDLLIIAVIIAIVILALRTIRKSGNNCCSCQGCSRKDCAFRR